MAGKTALTIRVQARGGKFLADDIGGAAITIKDARSGELLASGVTRGSSGELVEDSKVTPEQVAAASKRVIVTPAESPGQAPTVRWLVAQPGESSRFVAELGLDRPTLLEISAFGALGGLQSAHRVTATTWIDPGKPGPADPGFVLGIPGLLVQVLEPGTHTELATLPARVPIRANVAMMCGCPINDGEPWLPEDFEVVAQVRRTATGQQGAEVGLVSLAFDKAAKTAGLFTGAFEVTRPGYYEATVVAVQTSTGNVGAGTVTFFNKGS